MLESHFVPALQSDSKRLMIILHGLGDSAAGYLGLLPELKLDWMNYLLVNAPDPYFGGYSWYDFAGDPKPGVERSRKMLFELLDDQKSKGFALSDTILFGFSQGSLMTFDVGMRYPEKLAGLVGVSGYVFEQEQLIQELSPVARAQRVLMTHGTQDPIIPSREVHESVKELIELGLNIEWRFFEKAHTIAGEAEISVIRDFIVAGYPSK